MYLPESHLLDERRPTKENQVAPYISHNSFNRAGVDDEGTSEEWRARVKSDHRIYTKLLNSEMKRGIMD